MEDDPYARARFVPLPQRFAVRRDDGGKDSFVDVVDRHANSGMGEYHRHSYELQETGHLFVFVTEVDANIGFTSPLHERPPDPVVRLVAVYAPEGWRSVQAGLEYDLKD